MPQFSVSLYSESFLCPMNVQIREVPLYFCCIVIANNTSHVSEHFCPTCLNLLSLPWVEVVVVVVVGEHLDFFLHHKTSHVSVFKIQITLFFAKGCTGNSLGVGVKGTVRWYGG